MRTSFKFAFAVLVLGLALQSGWILAAEIAGIHFYQIAISPMLSKSPLVRCRFQPTCATYALEQLTAQGLWRGNQAVAIRLFACSPFRFLASRTGSKD
ncbi:MAG: membrane protein insertion efficiency factor YidD [Acidobacteria bacterium]|nr:membrane protein insertion efficiency factor YidD [Acidobacteriota bacterium]